MTRWSTTKLCIMVAALAGAATVGMAQQPFGVDPSFQLAPTVLDATIRGVVELPDGRLLVSGEMRNSDQTHTTPRVIRLMPSGTRDWSFDWAPGGGYIRSWNDKWYVGGVSRLYADGTWDMGFHLGFSTPQTVSELFHPAMTTGFSVRPDGGLVLFGEHTLTDSARGFLGFHHMVWVDSVGELDTTHIHRKANAALWYMTELPDGKYITAGGGGMYDGHPVGGIIRIHPDGAADTTFQTSSLTWGYPVTYLPLSDGKILAGGSMQFGWGQDTLSLVRLLSDGSIDPDFNNYLDVRNELGAPYTTKGSVLSITPWGADRLIITGSFTHVAGEVRGGIAMLDTAGYLANDHFIGPGCGPATHPVTGELSMSLHGLLPLANDKLLVYGSYTGYDDGFTNHIGQRAITKLYGPTVGIAEHEAVSFSLYPNPATTYATVELEAMPRNGQLVLRDALGREVLRQRVAGYHNTVPLQGLGKGVYLLELWEEGERRVAQRLVVQ
jgi:uncharacterized delta-60 repeat protein